MLLFMMNAFQFTLRKLFSNALFSSRSLINLVIYIQISDLCSIHFCLMKGKGLYFIFFLLPYRYQIVPDHLLTFLSLWNYVGTFITIQLTIYVQIYFWILQHYANLFNNYLDYCMYIIIFHKQYFEVYRMNVFQSCTYFSKIVSILCFVMSL